MEETHDRPASRFDSPPTRAMMVSAAVMPWLTGAVATVVLYGSVSMDPFLAAMAVLTPAAASVFSLWYTLSAAPSRSSRLPLLAAGLLGAVLTALLLIGHFSEECDPADSRCGQQSQPASRSGDPN